MRPETTHPELTILMPCLNEAETIATCLKKASSYLSKSNIRCEILVADNGSTDGSREIAQGLGARVVSICERGYGAALIGGLHVDWHAMRIFRDRSSPEYGYSRPFADFPRENL